MKTYLVLFCISAGGTILITPFVADLGNRLRAWGPREEDRERLPIPRLGGLAVFAASLVSWTIVLVLPTDVGKAMRADWQTLVLLLLTSSVVLMMGVWDDLKGMNAKEKFVLQGVAAGIAWWAGFRITLMPMFGFRIGNPLVSFLLTCLWIVAVTNSLNLIDGLDGLAAGIAFFATGCMLIVSLIQSNPFALVISVALAGALLGFLKFNFVPAKIYLGDTGSLFLGFTLAVMAINTGQKSSTLVTLVVPYMALGLPLLDTSLTVARRFLNGKPVFQPDRDHVHHRILKKSQTPQVAVLMLYAMAALFGFGSLVIVKSGGNIIVLITFLIATVAWFLTTQLDYAEFEELNAYVAGAMRHRRKVMANQILIRKASRQMDAAASLDEVWRHLTEILDTLSFDEVRCELTDGQVLVSPKQVASQRSEPNGNEACWSVSIPLRLEGEPVGHLHLRRSINKDSLPFQFFSILNTLIPSFEKQLGRGNGRRLDPESDVGAESQPVTLKVLLTRVFKGSANLWGS